MFEYTLIKTKIRKNKDLLYTNYISPVFVASLLVYFTSALNITSFIDTILSHFVTIENLHSANLLAISNKKPSAVLHENICVHTEKSVLKQGTPLCTY